MLVLLVSPDQKDKHLPGHGGVAGVARRRLVPRECIGVHWSAWKCMGVHWSACGGQVGGRAEWQGWTRVGRGAWCGSWYFIYLF